MKDLLKRLLLCTLAFCAVVTIGQLTAQPSDSLILVATATSTFSPLLWGQGENNMGGFKNWMIWYPMSILTSCPALPDSPSDDDEFVTATGKFVMKSGEDPVFIYATEATVGYNSEPVGEIDGKSFQQTVEMLYPGSNAQSHSYASRFKNQPGIAVIEDENGNQYMIGNKDHFCYLSAAFQGGKERADRKGLTFTGIAASNESAVFLETKLIVDPLTGSVTYPTSAGV